MAKTSTQKRIEHFGWKVEITKAGLKATKGRLVVKADTLSDLRFLIRFEKFYTGQLEIPGKTWTKKGWVK